MEDRYQPAAHSWRRKFQNAFRGAWLAMRDQRSMWVHATAAVGVVLSGWILGLCTWQWCVLVLCIIIVLAAELFNTALEHLAKAVEGRPNDQVRDALDVGSAAVLAAAGGAVIVGILVFLL